MLEEAPAQISIDSIKIIGESIGLPGVGDDVAKWLAEDATFKLKVIIQDALKLADHCNKRRLTTQDFDNALKGKNIEPIYGVSSSAPLPWRLTSGGGRDLHFLEERELEISELLSMSLPKLPAAASVKAHWLAIEGAQPAIPENPPPLSLELQREGAVDPARRLGDDPASRAIHGRGLKSVETVRVKQLATHELSAEQQLYYKEITEACVGSDESKRGEALHSLSYDPGLHQMVARLCTFISEGVRVNVVQKNLALLIYLMRMAKALLDNNSLYLEKYLHELTPSVVTCIVSRQLCLKPDVDNHWALRDFAAKLLAQICRHYNTTTNALQTRITRVFVKCLNTDSHRYSTVYGAVVGLGELGAEVVRSLVVPRTLTLARALDACGAQDAKAAGNVRTMLLRYLPAALRSGRVAPDVLQEYQEEFGSLGASLHAATVKLRQLPQSSAATPSPAPLTPSLAASPAPSPLTRIMQPAGGVGRTVVVRPQSHTPQPHTPQPHTPQPHTQLHPLSPAPSIIHSPAPSPAQSVTYIQRPPGHFTPQLSEASIVTATNPAGGVMYVKPEPPDDYSV